MAKYRIRLVEITTMRANAVMVLEAQTPEAAATHVLVAYHEATTAKRYTLLLPDGQRILLERGGVVGAEVLIEEVDASDTTVRQFDQLSLNRGMN